MKPQPFSKNSPPKTPAERVVKDIRRQTRRHFSAEDKIRIVLDGLREPPRVCRSRLDLTDQRLQMYFCKPVPCT